MHTLRKYYAKFPNGSTHQNVFVCHIIIIFQHPSPKSARPSKTLASVLIKNHIWFRSMLCCMNASFLLRLRFLIRTSGFLRVCLVGEGDEPWHKKESITNLRNTKVCFGRLIPSCVAKHVLATTVKNHQESRLAKKPDLAAFWKLFFSFHLQTSQWAGLAPMVGEWFFSWGSSVGGKNFRAPRLLLP